MGFDVKNWKVFVDGANVHMTDRSVGAIMPPESARYLAGRLLEVADEAESVPRFTEEDLAAILVEWRANKATGSGSFLSHLRALRKPRT